jgi:hypothetical protein
VYGRKPMHVPYEVRRLGRAFSLVQERNMRNMYVREGRQLARFVLHYYEHSLEEYFRKRVLKRRPS